MMHSANIEKTTVGGIRNPADPRITHSSHTKTYHKRKNSKTRDRTEMHSAVVRSFTASSQNLGERDPLLSAAANPNKAPKQPNPNKATREEEGEELGRETAPNGHTSTSR